MEVCAPPTFSLTNGADRPPIVHSFFEPTTHSWQHLVVDPSTKHCVIVDPVRDCTAEEVNISTQAADALLGVVQAHQYIVDLILETGSGPTDEVRSAAWYLRMQLMTRQASSPQIATSVGGGAVVALERLFERKYGARGRLQSAHQDVFAAGPHLVGRMRIQAASIPGALTPRRRMYIVGPYVFGAHSLAMCEKNLDGADTRPEESFSPAHPMTAEFVQQGSEARARDVQLWTSMMRVLMLPESSRLYFDCGSPGQEAAVAMAGGVAREPFETVDQCRNANEYLGLTEQEFVIRRAGERRAAAEAGLSMRKTTKKQVMTHHHNESTSSWSSMAILNRS